QITANHLPVLDELSHHVVGHVNRNCETDALVPARAARKNGGVNADKIAVQIDHRAARVARIDCGVRLNEIFKPLDLSIHSAARCTHDSHRGRFADSKWIADCEHNVAYLQF